jgi:CRP-like cAMP-binding protein
VNNTHGFDPGPASNKLLAALLQDDFELLRPHLTTLRIDQGTVLCEVGQEVDHVYFPLSGMISIAVVMRDGKPVETATVGREGVFGAMSGLHP